MGEINIRDLSRFTSREWVPPIGAMGGPPAHELYRDLVRYAGLRLFRDKRGNPFVEIHDGEHRRMFLVPSDELREALDRFRMRRSLRAVPDQELAELTRIIQARVSDPDIFIPMVDEPYSDPPEPPVEVHSPMSPTPATRPSSSTIEEELDAMVQELDEVREPSTVAPAVSKAPSAWNDVVEPPAPVVPATTPIDLSISGGRTSLEPAGDRPRYVRVLRGLTQNGGWLGTTSEISSLTGDDPEKVIQCLREYYADLANDDIAVAPVETKKGWRWLAVDLNRLASSQRGESLPPEGRRGNTA